MYGLSFTRSDMSWKIIDACCFPLQVLLESGQPLLLSNIYNGKSTFSVPDGSSPAWPSPSPARGQILEIWGPENQKHWNPKNQKIKIKVSKSKSVLPKMSARSGLAGKRPRGALFGAIPGNFLHGTGKTMRKKLPIPLGAMLLGHIAEGVTDFGG